MTTIIITSNAIYSDIRETETWIMNNGVKCKQIRDNRIKVFKIGKAKLLTGSGFTIPVLRCRKFLHRFFLHTLGFSFFRSVYGNGGAIQYTQIAILKNNKLRILEINSQQFIGNFHIMVLIKANVCCLKETSYVLLGSGQDFADEYLDNKNISNETIFNAIKYASEHDPYTSHITYCLNAK